LTFAINTILDFYDILYLLFVESSISIYLYQHNSVPVLLIFLLHYS